MSKTPEQIRKEITDKIIEAINKGTPPWRQPWAIHPNTGSPRNFQSKRRYNGVNALLLWLDAQIKGYDAQQWGTVASWKGHLGVHVKKGESASWVTLFRQIPKKDKESGRIETTDSGRPKTIPLLRYYPMFNVEQMMAPTPETLLGVPGPRSIIRDLLGDSYKGGGKRTTPTTKDELLAIAEKYLSHADMPSKSMTRENIALAIHRGIAANLNACKVVAVVHNTEPDFAPAEQLMDLCGAEFVHKGSTACWNTRTDKISSPPKRSFDSMADYYQTNFHELIHWTQKPSRVGIKKQDGDDPRLQYAFNELVAEIGACFVLIELGVPRSEKMLPKSQSYLADWLKQMGGNAKFIFEAASHASKAADYLLAFVGKQNPAYEERAEDNENEETAERSVA